MLDLTNNQELMTTLACVALSPGLRSLLIFDAPATELQRLASLLGQALAATTDLPVRPYQLWPFENDDEVWGSLSWPDKASRFRLFSPERNAGELQAITIPDLAALSQTAARTCTMLIGADLAHLERHTEHQTWRLQQCWLASCAREDIGKVSPHLLDRFALRLQWSDIDRSARASLAERSARLLEYVPGDGSSLASAFPSAMELQLRFASQQRVSVRPETLAQIMAYVPRDPAHPRREIALARFAVALAQFAGEEFLQDEHIDEAARLLGITTQADDFVDDEADIAETDLASSAEPERELAEILPVPVSAALPETPKPTESLPVYLPDTSASPDLGSGTLCSEAPYPEDSAYIEREAASLQIAVARSAPTRAARGPIIGVEESDSLADLAIASTLITALKFQNWRRSREQALRKEIVFRPSDLRRYRRGAALETLLMILLDYTSVRERPDWQETLLPYLSQAYVERAGVVLIKVGAERPVSELQAELTSARNITVPVFGEALDLKSGAATPLAHGLNLAYDKLRHVLQHGRAITRTVTFLVITDGRGNVPSKLSHGYTLAGQLSGQEGVSDSLQIAARISTLPHVETIVLSPQPIYYPNLPKLLAQALNASLIPLPVYEERDKA